VKHGNSVDWHCLCRSTVGDSHVRRGTINQDNVFYGYFSGQTPHLAVAVADGHGSPSYARSHVGARFAVRTAVENLHKFIESVGESVEITSINRQARALLPQVLVNSWRKSVTDHLERYPLIEPEVRPEDAIRVYGATLLGAVVTREYGLFVQLGDGDILIVSAGGEVERAFSRDEYLIANQTTSLCQKEAWAEVMVRAQVFVARPALIMVSTDGYSNSFVNDEEFMKVGSDLCTTFQTDGPSVVRRHLRGWLQDASRAGSGDDTTVAPVYRNDITDLPQAPALDHGTTVSTEPSDGPEHYV